MKILSIALLSGALCLALLNGARPASAQPDPLQDPTEVGPPSPAVGAKVPGTYFGPPPSETQKELIGPYKLLKAAQVAPDLKSATLPLYQGKMRDGRPVWYVLTDTTDKMNADALGLNFSAKLCSAERGRAVRRATLDTDSTLVFDKGTVNFAPACKLMPGKGANAFPPSMAQPGSVGDADYTPLVKIVNAGQRDFRHGAHFGQRRRLERAIEDGCGFRDGAQALRRGLDSGHALHRAPTSRLYHLNECGLFDMNRHPRPVAHAYRQLLEEFGQITIVPHGKLFEITDRPARLKVEV